MRLEADDGRPETSPATTTRRSNGRSCSRARAASHPGRSGPGTTSRDRPRGAGSKASATAAPPGPRTTARPGGTSRSSRGGATGSWRWRWTFQNKRRRYSHEGRRDTGQRRPLPDIGAMQDTGRSPLHLLLDDRASRDGACGLCFCKLVSTVRALFQQRRRLVSNRNCAVGTRRPFLPGYLVMRACSLR